MTDTPLTDAELEEIAARCAAASEGPWGDDNGEIITEDGYTVAWIQQHGNVNTIAETGETYSKADGRFIARGRTDIPRLLATVAALRRELRGRE